MSSAERACEDAKAGPLAIKLAAAEADLATYARAIAQFDAWLGEQAAFFKQNPQVNRTFLDVAAKLMHTLRTVRHVEPQQQAATEHHQLNENTWCTRCDRFDPSGPCPGKPVSKPDGAALEEAKAIVRAAIDDYWNEDDQDWLGRAHRLLGDDRMGRYETVNKLAEERLQALHESESKLRAAEAELAATRARELAEAESYQAARVEALHLSEELDAERARVRELTDVINFDRTGLAAGLNHVVAVVKGYQWIADGHWGSYDYTQQTLETLQREVGRLIKGACDGASRALKASGERATAAVRSSQQAAALPAEQAKSLGTLRVGDTARLLKSKHTHPSWDGKSGEVVELDTTGAFLLIEGRRIRFNREMVERVDQPSEPAGAGMCRVCESRGCILTEDECREACRLHVEQKAQADGAGGVGGADNHSNFQRAHDLLHGLNNWEPMNTPDVRAVAEAIAAAEKRGRESNKTLAGCPGGDTENADPSASPTLGTVPGQSDEPQAPAERVTHEMACYRLLELGGDPDGSMQRYISGCEAEEQRLREEYAKVERLWKQATVDTDVAEFGVDPGDSAALLKLREAIDAADMWPSVPVKEAGDYEAAVSFMAELIRARVANEKALRRKLHNQRTELNRLNRALVATKAELEATEQLHRDASAVAADGWGAVTEIQRTLAAERAKVAELDSFHCHLVEAAEILRLDPGMNAVERHHAWLDRDDEERAKRHSHVVLHSKTCIWREEDDDGIGKPETTCGKPATHISCVPFVGSPTCEEHKCRCARSIDDVGRDQERAEFTAPAEKVSVMASTDARKAVLVDGCSCSAERYEECAGHAPECDLALLNQRMKLCPDCGNKRCPKAEGAEFICSGSNELGQVGVRAEPLPMGQAAWEQDNATRYREERDHSRDKKRNADQRLASVLDDVTQLRSVLKEALDDWDTGGWVGRARELVESTETKIDREA